jgi:hypothetical protein
MSSSQHAQIASDSSIFFLLFDGSGHRSSFRNSISSKFRESVFRIVEAEWPQCRRCQALSYWGSGNSEWVG